MLGSAPPKDGSRSRGNLENRWTPTTVDADTQHECELCEAIEGAHYRYGMYVCVACDHKFLP